MKRFISPITLWLCNRGLIRSGSQTPAGAPQARLSLPGVVRERLARFISPIALCVGTRVFLAFDTGRRHLLPMVPWGSVVTFISPAALCLGSRVSSLLTPEGSDSCQMALASPSPTLFHQSHFDWNLERFSVPGVRRRQPTRKPACRYWAVCSGAPLDPRSLASDN